MIAGDGTGSLQRGSIRGKANHVVILLRVLINDADARARREIVELVKENLFPRFIELSGRVRCSAQPRQRRPLLGVQHLFFALAHIALMGWPGS